MEELKRVYLRPLISGDFVVILSLMESHINDGILRRNLMCSQ